ncbi:MAG: hypothetical protein HeimC3_03690 [Candidatus Heimdallarchaeota archaeon LC_3]|nr:MAG: hypothetical protein HeimC3_03690 [Candidatus Heimdallarchaeota archaeon LC_3]
MIESTFNMDNFLWLSALFIFFILYLILYINFSYFWHIISENEFKLKYILIGFSIIQKGFQKRSVANIKSSYRQSNQKLLLLLSLRFFFLAIFLLIMFFNIFIISEFDLEIFLAFFMMVAFVNLLYELETRTIQPGYGKNYYGGSYAVYEFLSFIVLYLWIISGNYWDFNDFRINPWSLDLSIRIIQTLLALILIYCIARSSNYLGYKRHSNYEEISQYSFEMPVKLSMLQNLSQIIFQTITLFFITIITTEQAYKFIFGSNVDLWLYGLIFIFLLIFYSLISLFFSSVTYRIKSRFFSVNIILLVFFISLIAVLIYFLAPII